MVDAWRPRAASKSVKLQRPDSGYRVQSLRRDVAASILPVVRLGADEAFENQ